MPNKEDKRGAIWTKTTKNGDTYFSISIEHDGVKQQFVAFQNGFKDAENKPDFIVYLSRPREQ